jgi:hypothetical protein
MTATPQNDSKNKLSVFSNQQSRKILEFLLRNTQSTLTPTILPSDEIKYEQVESILGNVSGNASLLLSQMAAEGVLASELVDKVPACPQCGSTQLSTRYFCPQCLSHDITRAFLLEHLKCGKVGSEDSFRKGDEIICPKCQAVLHDFGVEYRAVGAWYECDKCKNSFSNPTHSHFCRPKHHEFLPAQVQLLPVHQYTINKGAIETIKREVLVYSEAIATLENLGLTVLAPHNLEGRSGQVHPFDAVIVIPKKGWRGEERVVAMDIIVKTEPAGLEAAKQFVAKARDARPFEAYMISVPGLTEDARSLLKNARFPYFEGASLKQAVQAFQEETRIVELIS